MQPYKSVKVGGGIGCKNLCQVSAEPLMKKLQGFIKVGFNRISVTLPSRSFTMHLVSPTIRRISLEKNRLASLNSGSLLMVSRTYAVSLGFKNRRVMSTPYIVGVILDSGVYCLKKIGRNSALSFLNSSGVGRSIRTVVATTFS